MDKVIHPDIAKEYVYLNVVSQGREALLNDYFVDKSSLAFALGS